MAEHCAQYRENLNVAVIVDSGLSVCLQMEGIDHVHVVEIGGCRLVSDVDRML